MNSFYLLMRREGSFGIEFKSSAYVCVLFPSTAFPYILNIKKLLGDIRMGTTKIYDKSDCNRSLINVSSISIFSVFCLQQHLFSRLVAHFGVFILDSLRSRLALRTIFSDKWIPPPLSRTTFSFSIR